MHAVREACLHSAPPCEKRLGSRAYCGAQPGRHRVLDRFADLLPRERALAERTERELPEEGELPTGQSCVERRCRKKKKSYAKT